MKKALVLLPMVAALTACGTFSSKDPYEKRAEAQMEFRNDQLKKVQKSTPSWFHKTPTASTSAIYGAGSASSTNQWMALDNAKVLAKASICASVDGGVSKKSKIYLSNTGGEAVEVSETAIVEKCRVADMSGVEVTKQESDVVNGKFYYWVEIAFPLGEANIIKTQKRQDAERAQAIVGSKQLFKEIDEADKSKQ